MIVLNPIRDLQLIVFSPEARHTDFKKIVIHDIREVCIYEDYQLAYLIIFSTRQNLILFSKLK